MKALLYKWAIKLAMKRPAPSRIPLSGYERVRTRNYATASLEAEDGNPSFLVTEVLPNEMRGLWFPGAGPDSEERIVSNSELSSFNLIITYYFHELELRYRSPVRYLAARFFCVPHLQLWCERYARMLFNRRALTRSDSIKILRHIVEATVNNNNYGCGPATLMTELYGPRWVHHPDLERLHHYHSLVLESLKGSGDLIYDNHRYRVTPQALSRIEQFDQDDERFRMEHLVQKRMFWLTIALAIIAAIQAYAAYMAIPAALP